MHSVLLYQRLSIIHHALVGNGASAIQAIQICIVYSNIIRSIFTSADICVDFYIVVCGCLLEDVDPCAALYITSDTSM